jgi:hypothetical protein
VPWVHGDDHGSGLNKIHGIVLPHSDQASAVIIFTLFHFKQGNIVACSSPVPHSRWQAWVHLEHCGQPTPFTQSIKAHSYVLRFHTALTTFFRTHRGVHLVLCWALKDNELEGNWMARSLATAACRRDLADLPDGMDCILSVAYQKDCACRRAFHQWELDYHLARAHNDLQVDATGFPLDGAAYQYAISQPPSKVNHPLWSAVVAMEKDKWGRKTWHPLFT